MKSNETNTSCPHCLNTIGFVFGTCSRCGYNYLSCQFEYVKVRVDDLPDDYVEYLVRKHSVNTKKFLA